MWGYFKKKSGLGHNPEREWTPVGEGNVLEGEDHAFMEGWPADLPAASPTFYSPGGLSWVIPNHYAVKGEEGAAGTKFATITQGMQITDKKGTRPSELRQRRCGRARPSP